MKGDRVEVVVVADDGSKTYEIVATRAGRRVEVSSARGGIIEVAELTRTGEPVRRARFMASRVLALVEHPAAEAAAHGSDAGAAGARAGAGGSAPGTGGLATGAGRAARLAGSGPDGVELA